MFILSNKKINEYLCHSEQLGQFAKFCGTTRVAMWKRLRKDDLFSNLTNLFIHYIFATLDSGGYFGSKTRLTRLEQHEINVLANQKAQEEIKKWYEENKTRKLTLKCQEKKVKELEKRALKARKDLGSFGG